MHCAQCGKEILSNSRFCSACGAPVASAAAGWGSAPGTSTPPPAASSVQPELLRPRSGRMLGGVCAAFARTYGWNVTLVRILLVVAGLHFGIGAVAYIIAWILIPEEPYLLPYRSV